MKSVNEHRDVVQVYMNGERQAGGVLGPFDRDQFPMMQVSPIGVIPKGEPGKCLLYIFHLRSGLILMMVLIMTYVLCPTCQWTRWRREWWRWGEKLCWRSLI